MSGPKRGRACIACASIKIKCQLGSDHSLEPPCERCTRLGKECVLSAPKRQKDRVAELEAQVATLTRLLQAQGIRDGLPSNSTTDTDSNSTASGPSPSSRSTASINTAKKRRLSLTSAYTPSTDSGASVCDIARIDELVSYEQQQRLVDKYFSYMFPSYPLVPIGGDCSLDALRMERPLLLQSITYAAGPNVLPVDVQEDVGKAFISNISASVASKRNSNLLELLQAMEIACLWYRSPKHNNGFALYEMIQLTSELARDLGMVGPLSSPAVPPAQSSTVKGEVDTTDAWRNWLVCHLLSANVSQLTRKPMPWEDYTGQAIIYLEVSNYALPTDRWLATYFRVEHLCERVIHTMQLTDPDLYLELSDPSTSAKILTCRNTIRDWRALVSHEQRTPTIKFLERLATVYMYEVVLHSKTNKHTFAAPYAPFCLSVTDFPAPIITQDHINAVYELLSGLHATIDAFCDIDVAVLAAQAASICAARVSYAHYLLAKLYIACTAPGNTFGGVMDVSLLRVDEYADKLINVADQLTSFAGECVPARILGVSKLIKNFYTTYNASLLADIDPIQEDLAPQLPPGIFHHDLTGWTRENQAFTAGRQSLEWDTFFRLSEGAPELGMDLLFPESQSFDQPFDQQS